MSPFANKPLTPWLAGAMLLCIILLSGPVHAQRTLTPVKSTMDELEGLIKTAKNKITKVNVQTETGVVMDLNCEYEGFNEKKYSLKVEILNKLKQPLKEIIPVVVELNSRAKSVDFNVQFKPLPNQTYQTNSVESAFLRLTVVEEGGTELEKLLGESNRAYLFDCKKAWAVKTISNNNTIVEIKLVPLPTATNLKQTN